MLPTKPIAAMTPSDDIENGELNSKIINYKGNGVTSPPQTDPGKKTKY